MLSSREREILAGLESQFTDESRSRRWQPGGVPGTTIRRVGWLLTAVGLATTVAVFTISTVAAFAGFVVAFVGALAVVSNDGASDLGRGVRRMWSQVEDAVRSVEPADG